MKQQLSEALAFYTPNPGVTPSDSGKRAALDRYWEQRSLILAAARLVERLLPGECPHGKTKPHDYRDLSLRQVGATRIVHCTGWVWDEGIVEAVAKAIYGAVYPGREMDKPKTRDFYKVEARAVLSALVELLTEKVET